jgi:hypothetical protein
MILTGIIGLLAAAIGWWFQIYNPMPFVGYWFCVAVVALAGSLLLVRRQAWEQAEPFWSPPTRRVAQAMLPPLAAGCAVGALVFVAGTLSQKGEPPAGGYAPNRLVLICLPLAWVILYGCAVHAAGFFMQRGMRLFGWGFVIGGCAVFLPAAMLPNIQPVSIGHALMGFFFGLLHLAYGTYLYFSEQPRNET